MCIIKKKKESYGLKCVSCGYCVSFCPTGAIGCDNRGVFFNRTKCKVPVCYNCVKICVINALEISPDTIEGDERI